MRWGAELVKKFSPGSIITMTGGLGAGKTTLVKGAALALDIQEPITSPTYSIVCEYQAPIPLYHMDLYRLSGSEEFEYMGLEDILYGKGICFIEWGERAEEALPEDRIHVDIQVNPDGSRKITLQGLEL